MSRTYRATKGDRWWMRRHTDLSAYLHGWQWHPDTIAAYQTSDNAHRDGSLGQTLKAFTKARRRADTRFELGRVMKDVEHDFVSREGLYRGHIWHFD